MQGKRNDIIEEVKRLLYADEIRYEESCAPVEHKLKSRDIVARNYDILRATVARYLRINELYDNLKNWIDDESNSIRLVWNCPILAKIARFIWWMSSTKITSK